MPNQFFAFISYRRTDTQQVSRGLHVQLRDRFGGNHIFMDVAGVSMGEIWPERLWRELDRATVVLAVIGPTWLTAADRYGRRRLDLPDDWVSAELIRALARSVPTIPLLVGRVRTLPPPEALPEPLRALLNREWFELRDDQWDADVGTLCSELISRHGFMNRESSVLMPDKRVKVPALSESEVDLALKELPGWEPVESVLARDYPNSRLELRKAYRFKSFQEAIDFMQAASAIIRRASHHPRWENQWRTVIVYLSTWDIGHKISKLDVELAHGLDAVYATFCTRSTDIRTQ